MHQLRPQSRIRRIHRRHSTRPDRQHHRLAVLVEHVVYDRHRHRCRHRSGNDHQRIRRRREILYHRRRPGIHVVRHRHDPARHLRQCRRHHHGRYRPLLHRQPRRQHPLHRRLQIQRIVVDRKRVHQLRPQPRIRRIQDDELEIVLRVEDGDNRDERADEDHRELEVECQVGVGRLVLNRLLDHGDEIDSGDQEVGEHESDQDTEHQGRDDGDELPGERELQESRIAVCQH